MKKAKKILALILAVVMIASAACLPVYAKTTVSSYGKPAKMTSNQKYYFNAEQGCSWVLDMLDDLLADAYIVLHWKELLNNNTLGGLVDSIIGRDTLDFTSIDNAVQTVYDLVGFIEETNKDWGWLIGGVYGDLDLITTDGLNINYKRGSRADNYATGSSDMMVLFSLLSWLGGNDGLHQLLMGLVTGDSDFGFLDGTIKGINIAGMPLLEDIDKYLPVLLYQLLIDDAATEMPAGETLETAVQKVVNWALIDGTGEASENGGNSILGYNFKPLIGDALTYDQVSITNISVYKLVNNLINGLLNGMLAPMLGDLIADLVGINEDGSVDDASTFNLIVGLVEGLLVDNGANPPVYTEAADSRTPGVVVNDLVDWLFKDGALQVFIKTDLSGIGLTDNFMSLLNDLIRLAINLLPVLGLEIPDGILPSADALTDFYYYKNIVDEETGEIIGKERCLKSDPDKFDQLYQTYYGKKACFPVYKADGKTVDYYRYFGGEELPVNTTDKLAAEYENPDFIRPYYLMSMDQVWAAVVKAVFCLIVEGPYFPEWANTMESVLAYGVAALAAAVVPEGDWYDRLDAWHITGSTEPYEIRTGKVVTPLPYTNPAARSTSILPTGAMEIGAGLGAYYFNTLFDLDSNEKFTVLNTSFEQLLTELALWGMTTYVPMLGGEINPRTGLVYTSNYNSEEWGEPRYPGTFAKETNDLINACYSNFPSRTKLANPDWGAVYTYLDSTLFSLIPAGWLPAQYGSSYSLFNDWLFNNIVKFDLQGLLGILSANESGELTKPLLTVIFSVIDHVLALVFCGDAVLLPVDRNNATKSVFKNPTSITTFTALLEDGDGDKNASLPQFIHRLLSLLNKHKGVLLATFLPIIMGGTWERPFDYDALGQDTNFENVLGNDMTRFKIADLENQIKTLTENVNATQINKTIYTSKTPVEFGVYTSAEAAEKAQAELGGDYNHTEEGVGADGAATFTVFRNLNADDVLEMYVQQYGEDADIYVDTVEKVKATSTTPAVYEFNVYQSKDYLLSAERSDATDDAGSYYVFSNFKYKSINPSSPSNPLVTWDDGPYYFWASEDANPYAYYYENYKAAILSAQAVVDSYNTLATTTLPDAFGEWFKYSIDAYAIEANIYDRNGDGRAVKNETPEAGYEAATETSPGYPVDGYPTAPEGILYPFYTDTDGSPISWTCNATDRIISQTRNSFTRANYEVLTMAEEYGNDPANKVLLEKDYIEKVVRYALWANNGKNTAEAMRFDIIQEADGSYIGDRQWAHLSDTEIAQIKAVCDGYHMFLEKNEETGEYEIYRKAFAYTSQLNFLYAADGTTAIGQAPIASRHYVPDDGPNDAQKAENAIYNGYELYIKQLYDLRRSLYNQLDTLNWRMEEAEKNRAKSIDTTMLDWALNHTRAAYISSDNKRNLKYVNTVDGEDIYTKVYTSSTYSEFQIAYDYANSLAKTGIAQASGVTQSMVTMAYRKLLAAYNKLALYLGDAEWLQYIDTLTLAKQLARTTAEGGYADHESLGLKPESRQALNDVIAQAIQFSGDLGEAGDTFRKENFDCERQQEIDAMWSTIDNVIKNLQYISDPDITIPSNSNKFKHQTSKEYDNKGNAYTYGWIFGLKEGEEISVDDVTLVGMIVNETKGDYIVVEESALGSGTGTKVDGYIDRDVRFSYKCILYGDVNGDARIDGTDWAKVSYYVLTKNMAEEHIMEAANADHQKGLTVADADLIKAHYNYSKTIDQNVSSQGTGTTGL